MCFAEAFKLCRVLVPASGCAVQDRLTTLEAVREAGISVCAGGIIGLGEGPSDRVGLIHQLATLPAHPESVPINALVAVAGTPLGKDGLEPPTGFDMARCIATARVVMPKSMVRLSAGRLSLNPSDQVLPEIQTSTKYLRLFCSVHWTFQVMVTELPIMAHSG